jgi:dGTPase
VYVGRDIEDAITTGVINSEHIPRDIFAALGGNNGEIVGTFLEDMVENSGQQYISISRSKATLLHDLIAFNDKHIYHSEAAERYKKQARHVLKFLFDELTQVVTSTKRFRENGSQSRLLGHTFVYRVLKQFLTEDMDGQYAGHDPDSLIVMDFIAGMTDNFAVDAYRELSMPQATV